MGERRRRVSDLKIEQLLRMDREYFSNETSPLQVDSILDLRDERAETKRLREENNGLAARIIVWSENDKTLRDALKLVLLFYVGVWSPANRQKWKDITEKYEATTKIMCDHIRSALSSKAPTTESADDD